MSQYRVDISQQNTLNEETLDPSNWDELRSLGHQMLDEMLDYLATVRTRPVWQPVPEEIKNHFKAALPINPVEPMQVYEEFKQYVLPYPTGNIHPRFWGWVMGTGTPIGMLADMLAAGINAHVAGYDQAATFVEEQVIAWLAELMAMPAQTSGLLVSGATIANLIGLATARNIKAGFNLREQGLQGNEKPQLVLYGSTETHSWAQKAVELLGLGNEAFRRIPVDDNFQIDMDLLCESICLDRAKGRRPFCVIGNAGTVNTGAIDDLNTLASICRNEDLWLHVDGAFGALAALSPKLKPLVAGIEKADSLAFDLHKWGYLPYGVACVLVLDSDAHQRSFSVTPSYLTKMSRGIAAKPLYFADLGIELSRSFRALKVWMSFKTHGVNAYARLIEQNVEQAHYLYQLIETQPLLEALAPAPSNIVCFRFRSDALDNLQLNRLNQEILLQVQESGLAIISSTMIGEKFALRVANTNHRSLRSDFELLVQAIVSIGQTLLGDGLN
ncbi:MAG: pyridoxal-dependent decarboxylase [Acidobacteriota bacterium]